MSKRGTVMLEEPEQGFVSSSTRFEPSGAPRRSAQRSNAKLRSDYGEDFADEYDDDARSQESSRQRKRGLTLKLRPRVPKSFAGRIATAIVLLLLAGIGIALLMLTRNFLLHDDRFIIRTPSAIEIQGNRHLTSSQLLHIFGDDIDRNIFNISLLDRQEELEQLPWVQHATIMRLLPDRIRVSILERVPVAFARQGTHISLVDANGILLEMEPSGEGTHANPNYSFPVVTGVSAGDPLSTRAARMKIFQRFIADLDSSGQKVSSVLSEVDLSNPEDVKALIPENSSEILVHFGDDHFLDRYRRLQEHLPAWHTQYPNLASVDMRYEREVVLDMAKSAVPKDDAAAVSDPSNPAKADPPAKASTPSKPAPVAAHIASAHVPAKAPAHVRTARPARAIAHKPKVHIKAKRPKHVAPHIRKPAPKKSAPAIAALPKTSPQPPSSASAAARSSFLAKPSAGKSLLPAAPSHSPQVAPR